MILRTLGGLELEGSDFSRPMPLLLLTYMTLVGRCSRTDLARTLFSASADAQDNLSVALRRLNKIEGTPEVPAVYRGVGNDLESCVECDVKHVELAGAEGAFERVCELYRGPFLKDLEQHRSVDASRWSYDLTAWVHDERMKVAGAVLAASTRLARARFDRDEVEAGRTYTALGLAVFLDQHHERRPRQPGRVRFAEPDLLALHALLRHDRSVDLPAFLERAAAYQGLAVPTADAEMAVPGGLGLVNVALHRKPFVGRAPERERVAAALRATPRSYVTVLGRGGVGKTSLVTRVAIDLHDAGHFPDGTVFVSLENVKPHLAAIIPVRIADALGVLETLRPSSDTLGQVVAYLRRRRLLLVLDNFEHVVERSDVPDRLVSECPDVAVLVTSRARLGTAREHVIELEGLTLAADDGTPGDVGSNDAVSLFVLNARRRTRDFVLTDRTARLVSKICRLVEGHPLSIDLAAGLVDVVPLEELAERMDHDLSLFVTDSPDVPERQRSLRSIWNSSWELLEGPDQALLRSLAVFDGGFDWSAAHAVANAGVLPLRRLVDKSLLRSSSTQRFSFHASLRAFVREKFVVDPGHTGIEERHRAYFLERAREMAQRMRGRDARAAIAFFEVEGANLRGAWETAQDVDQLLEFVDVLEAFQTRHAVWDERQVMLDRALDAARRATRVEVLPKLWNAMASVYLQRGELEHAEHALRAALSDRVSPDQDATLADTLSQLGGVHYQRRELDQALARFEEAKQLHLGLGNIAQAMSELSNVGAVRFQQGRFDEAIEVWNSALTVQRRLRDLETQALLLSNLGAAYQVVGRLEHALLAFDKAKDLLDTIGDVPGSLATSISLGSVHFLRGEFARSLELNTSALEQYRKRDDTAGEALVLNNIAMIHERQGLLERALDLLTDALAMQEHDDERLHRATTLYNLSTVTLQLGRRSRAEAHAREALELANETENVMAKGYALMFLGDALTSDAERRERERAYEEAEEVFHTTSDKAGLVDVYVRRAELAYLERDLALAAQRAEAASTMALSHGLLPPARQALRIAARVAQAAGHYAEALSLLDRALSIGGELGHTNLEADRRLALELGELVRTPGEARS